MTARPYSRLEPVSRPDDSARAVATAFVVIAGIGAIPAAYWTLLLGAMTISAFAEAKIGGGFAMLGMFGYAMLGFAQLRFYAKRSSGKMRENARAWWVSTYLYNLVPLGVSLSLFIVSPHIASLIATVWFAGLSSLAVYAYRGEELLLRAERA